MPIEFPCPNCGRQLRTPDEAAGKKAKCPNCDAITDVPRGGHSAVSPFKPTAGEGTSKEQAGAAPDESPAVKLAGPYFKSEPISHGKVDFVTALNQSWQIFTENIGPCSLIGVVLFAVYFVLMFFGQIGGMIASITRSAPAFFGFQAFYIILSFVVGGWLMIGMVNFSLKLLRTGDTKVRDLFSTTQYYGRAAKWMLLTLLIVYILVPAMTFAPAGLIWWILGQQTIAMLVVFAVIGGVVWMVFVIWFWLKYLCLSMVFVIDRDVGVLESMRLSNAYMSGNKLITLALFFVASSVCTAFACCTFYIGYIFVYPFLGVLSGVIYMQATGQRMLRSAA